MLERVDRTQADTWRDASAALVPIYVINLDRSAERWQRMHAQAATYGLNLVRIPALDGRIVEEHERIGFHSGSFYHHNGRTALAGEYGCYRSHLMALEAFVASGEASAIIVEDDVDLNDMLIPRALAAIEAVAVPEGSVIKLANHRSTGFRTLATSAEGDAIGRCLHGPQGSAACYIVTRQAAQALLTSLQTMVLPYDIALERGWATGVATFSVENDLVEFSPHRSDTAIGTRAQYRAVKRHFLLRMTAHWFRTRDQVRRWLYANFAKRPVSR